MHCGSKIILGAGDVRLVRVAASIRFRNGIGKIKKDNIRACFVHLDHLESIANFGDNLPCRTHLHHLPGSLVRR